MSDGNKKLMDTIKSISEASKFCFISEKLGNLSIGHLTVNSQCQLEEKAPNFEDAKSLHLAQKLFSIITKKIKKEKNGNYIEIPLSEKEVSLLKDDELQEMARFFIELNFDPKKRKYYVEKMEKEDNLDHLRNLLIKQKESFQNIFKEIGGKFKQLQDGITGIFKPTSFDNLVSESTRNLYKENLSLSDNLTKSLNFHNLPTIDEIELLENPLYKTNEHLENVASQLNHLTRLNRDSSLLIKNLDSIGVNISKEMMNSNEKNANRSNIMLSIAIIALLANLIFPIYNSSQSKEADKNSEEILLNINSEIETSINSVVSALKSLVNEISNLKVSNEKNQNQLKRTTTRLDSFESNINKNLNIIKKRILENSDSLQSIKNKIKSETTPPTPPATPISSIHTPQTIHEK